MTEEIQKRIEAIKAGKVPDGYKKAVVGIVPSEWQEKRLSDLLKFQNGVNAEKEKFNSGIKMISVMDILDERPIVYDAIRGQVDIDEKAPQIAITSWTPRGKNLGHGWSRRIYP